MISDAIQQQLEKIGKDTYLADRELAIQRNKLMKPIYAKRRDILKQVPNFWGTAVSSSPYACRNLQTVKHSFKGRGVHNSCAFDKQGLSFSLALL
jgi:template-activating factor I